MRKDGWQDGPVTLMVPLLISPSCGRLAAALGSPGDLINTLRQGCPQSIDDLTYDRAAKEAGTVLQYYPLRAEYFHCKSSDQGERNGVVQQQHNDGLMATMQHICKLLTVSSCFDRAPFSSPVRKTPNINIQRFTSHDVPVPMTATVTRN